MNSSAAKASQKIEEYRQGILIDGTARYIIRYQGGKRPGFCVKFITQDKDKRYFQGCHKLPTESWADCYDRAISAAARHWSRTTKVPLEKIKITLGAAPGAKVPSQIAQMLPSATLARLNPFRRV